MTDSLIQQHQSKKHAGNQFPSLNRSTVARFMLVLSVFCLYLPFSWLQRIESTSISFGDEEQVNHPGGIKSPVQHQGGASDSTKHDTTIQTKDFDQLAEELRVQNLTFYLYDDEDIRQPSIIDNLVNNRGKGKIKARYRAEALLEHYILDAMEQHPLRTRDPLKADVFIVSARIGANIIYKGTLLGALVKALTSKPSWHYGHRHVVLALNSAPFAHEHRQDVQRIGFTMDFYEALSNCTIVHAYDDFACANLSSRGLGGDYKNLFAEAQYTLSNSGFSVGLLAEPNLTSVPATYDKFQSSANFLFYRTRLNSSFYNSTVYRHAPLTVMDELPQPSSVGFDLPPDQWLREISNSKFCIAGRGDTPHTHALLRSVKVGCIPVVVSDWYPEYAPTFASTLDMRDFCIFIDEKRFLVDPGGELRALEQLPESTIRSKIRALAFAQKVVAWDHPESVFVQAFLRESVTAFHTEPSPFNYFAAKDRKRKT
jgi:hypothetical protein